LESGIAARYVERRYSVQKRAKENQSVVTRKWRFKSQNRFLHPINAPFSLFSAGTVSSCLCEGVKRPKQSHDALKIRRLPRLRAEALSCMKHFLRQALRRVGTLSRQAGSLAMTRRDCDAASAGGGQVSGPLVKKLSCRCPHQSLKENVY
jgi:hypothetical protein